MITYLKYGSTVKIQINGSMDYVNQELNFLVNFHYINPLNIPTLVEDSAGETSCYVECSWLAFVRGCKCFATKLIQNANIEHRVIEKGRRVSILPILAAKKAFEIAKALLGAYDKDADNIIIRRQLAFPDGKED